MFNMEIGINLRNRQTLNINVLLCIYRNITLETEVHESQAKESIPVALP
jgi:hypothetical protein